MEPLLKQTDADHGRLYASVNPILCKFIDSEERRQDDFKTKILKYVESYSFLTQLVVYDDTRLEKLYVVLKFIINENLIKNIGSALPELRGDVSLQWYRLEKTYEGGILLSHDEKSLKLIDDYGTPNQPEVLKSLSDVIKAINDKFGGNISAADTIAIEQWVSVLKNDSLLRDIAKENSFEDFFKQFEKRFLDVVIEDNEVNRVLVKQIYTNPEFQRDLIISAAQLYHGWVKTNSLPPITPTDPARNRQIFRQTIYSCKGFVHWLDLYANEAALDFLIDNFDKKGVKELKLLAS